MVLEVSEVLEVVILCLVGLEVGCEALVVERVFQEECPPFRPWGVGLAVNKVFPLYVRRL